MSDNCLLTTLKDTVTDTSLLKLNELQITITAKGSTVNAFLMRSAVKQTIEIISGTACFTNSTGTANNGTTLTLSTSNTTFYISNADCVLSIPNKYALQRLDCSTSTISNNQRASFKLKDLSNCTALATLNSGDTNVEGDISALSNCTALTTLNLYNTNVEGDISALSNCTALATLNLYNTNVEGDISALSNCTALTTLRLGDTNVEGDISALSNCTALATLNLYNNNVEGDISALSNCTALTNLQLGSPNVKGDISALSNCTALATLNLGDTNVEGDISALSNCTALATLTLGNTNVEGDISALSNCTALATLNLYNNNVEGDISALSNCTKLGYISMKYLNTIYGDLSLMPASLYFISNQYGNSQFTWENTRAASAYILAMEQVTLNNYIDAMLNNQAKCTARSSSDSWEQALTVYGTRTSASDDAVTALKNKGYTVTVTAS